MNEEKIYNELRCLNKNQNKINVSQARGEEKIEGIYKEFRTLNGSVKKHAKKIYWIEKILWMVLGAFGAVQFYLNYLV